jgi:DMSO reductase anchor subunit
MTYHVTRREVWRGEHSIGRFAGTTVVLGSAATWAAGDRSPVILLSLALCATIKLSRELAKLATCSPEAERQEEVPDTFIGRAAYLLRFRFGGKFRARIALGFAGGVLLPLVSLVPGAGFPSLAIFGLILSFCGEWLERSLFFRTAVTPRMPGGM